MLKPLKLKTTHIYKYLEINEEGIKEVFDMHLLHNSYRDADSYARYIVEHPSEPIRLCVNGTVCGVSLNNFLVLQYTPDNQVDGILSFETKENMLEFFEEIEQ